MLREIIATHNQPLKLTSEKNINKSIIKFRSQLTGNVRKTFIMDNVKNSNHDWLGFKKRNFLALLSLPFLLLSIISFFLAGWPAIFSSVALAFGISGLALRIYKPQVKGKIISSIVILLSSIVLVLSMLVVLVWLSQSYNPPAFAYAIPSVILMIVGYSILIIALFIRLQAKAKFLFAGGIIFLINAVYLWLLPRVIL